MISSYDIESMQSNLKDDEIIKLFFSSDRVVIIDQKDIIYHPLLPLGQEENVSVLFVRRENDRKLMLNLNRVDYVCTSLKRYMWVDNDGKNNRTRSR